MEYKADHDARAGKLLLGAAEVEMHSRRERGCRRDGDGQVRVSNRRCKQTIDSSSMNIHAHAMEN